MPLHIKDEHVWLFGQLYSILVNFADHPKKVIGRIAGCSISIPDDQANELAQIRQTLLQHYPDATSLEIMRITDQIEAILDRHTPVGKESEDWFWTNKGFIRHDDWLDIRELSRALLIH